MNFAERDRLVRPNDSDRLSYVSVRLKSIGNKSVGLFSRYQLDHVFDEMLDAAGDVRPHYRALVEELIDATPDDLRRRQGEADRAFLTQGITFTVYGDGQGTERIFPFDLLPRI